MNNYKYQKLLGTFVAITILLALIFLALITMPGDEELDFNFPGSFSTTYISAFDWPPQVKIIPGEFVCIEAGEAIMRAGRTELRNINGRNYCITEIVEGAAGSTYTQYAYAYEHEGDMVTLTFSTRAPQCGNYPEPEMASCETEKATFSIDNLVDRAVREAED